MPINITYNPDAKALIIKLREERISASEMHSNVVMDYAQNGELVSLELLEFNVENLVHASEPTSLIKK